MNTKTEIIRYSKLNECDYVLDFTGVIDNKDRDFVEIDKRTLHLGSIIKCVVDDDCTRIESVVKGCIINMDISSDVIVATILSNCVKYEIKIPLKRRKESFKNFVVNVNEPFMLNHYSIEYKDFYKGREYKYSGAECYKFDVLPYIGDPRACYPGSRPFFHLYNGSHRLDYDKLEVDTQK